MIPSVHRPLFIFFCVTCWREHVSALAVFLCYCCVFSLYMYSLSDIVYYRLLYYRLVVVSEVNVLRINTIQRGSCAISYTLLCPCFRALGMFCRYESLGRLVCSGLRSLP